MSKFKGTQGKGAMRVLKRFKAQEAFERALKIWNDGTGYIWSRHGYKRVAHPYTFLPKSVRPEFPWPILNSELNVA